ncbi:MAG: polysaccharide biosynthesis tyrosine autokinase, partial [Gammaproteobacteria bacterium]|nr:polysaccharide biosynthesis tyrosine autokinase [Gammaproteobacteria bacterium]
EKRTGLPVYAVIPHSDKQKALEKRSRGKNGSSAVLAVADVNDPAIEGLRSLRTAFQFAVLDVNNNLLLITGVSPDVGKTFLSLNFGAVLASSGKRVLVIDADLRRGHLTQNLGIEQTGGLSEVIAGTCDVDQVVRETGVDNLEFVAAGVLPPNPSELLLHENFARALQEFSDQYDHVIIDSPPILAATDAGIIGRIAGATFLVAKAGAHRLHEIEQSVKQLRQAGVDLRGFVLNDVSRTSSPYTYGKYTTHAYAYKS